MNSTIFIKIIILLKYKKLKYKKLKYKKLKYKNKLEIIRANKIMVAINTLDMNFI